MKKAFALLICLSVVVMALASCNLIGSGDPRETVLAAEEKTSETPHKRVITIGVIPADGGEEDALSSKVELTVSGDAFKLRSVADIGDIQIKKTYVYVGGIIYLETSASVSDGSVDPVILKQKAPLSYESAQELVDRLGVGCSIGADDFNSVEGSFGTAYFSGMKVDSQISLNGIIDSYLAMSGKGGTLKGVSYLVATSGGLVVSEILNCSYVISDGGEAAIVCATTYDYESVGEVVAPEDADQYADVQSGDIIG